MNQKLKQAGLLAILAVFTISLTTSFVGDAEATPQSRGKISNEPVEPSVKAKNSAKATPEPEPETPRSESDPTRPAGGPVAPSVKEVRSAQARENVEAEEVPPTLVEMAIKDPNTKTGKEFVVTGDVTSFRAAYAIANPSNIDIQNVEILVTSDTESVKGELIGKYDNRHRTVSVMIDAIDPASVHAEIVSYEVS